MATSKLPVEPNKRIAATALAVTLALPDGSAAAWDIGYLNREPTAVPATRATGKGIVPPLDERAAASFGKQLGELDFAALGKDPGDPAAQKVAKELKQLWSLRQDASKGSGGIEPFAKGAGLNLAGARVGVKVYPASGTSAEQLAAAIHAVGGEAGASVGNVVLAKAPISAIPQLAENPAIGYVAAEERFEPVGADPSPRSGKAISDGLDPMAVSHLHAAGIRGKGVNIGVLDMGFARYDRLVANGELPHGIATQAFGASPFGDASEEPHGSAVAEIVHDVAPDAKLALAQFDGTDSTMFQGAKWLAEQGVKVINASFGNASLPTTGQSLQDRFVDQLVKQYGIVWINAAGNEGQKQWAAPLTDQDGNGLADVVVKGTNLNGLLVQTGNGPWAITVLWDDWGSNPDLPSATQDLDVFLVVPNPATGRLEPILQSTNVQNGHQPPVERIVAQSALPVERALLVIRATRANRPVTFRVIPHGQVKIAPTTPASSLSSPASAHEAIAVGAVDVGSGDLAAYSSQGPSDDGRTKPDISAPTNTESVAYGKRFPGTSSAAPHAAGFAALLRQLNPTAGVEQIRHLLVTHVRAMGDGAPNNAYGYGHIDGGKLEPSAAAGPGPAPSPAPTPEPEPPPASPSDTHRLDGGKLHDILDKW